MKWLSTLEKINQALSSLSIVNEDGIALSPDAAFLFWREITCAIRDNGKNIYLVGNGASASMASHFAADLAKNAHLHTQVFSDLALITAIANDISFDEVFAEPLGRRMKEGDMLVAISSSGRSPNILKAAATARRLYGSVVTLSAMAEDNPLRRLGMLNFYVPVGSYGLAETCHAAVLHHYMDMVSDATEQEAP